MLTIQYLEASPDSSGISVDAVLDRLRRAADRLPISHLLIGWRVAPAVLEACRSEAERLGMRFLRWHPLLAGSAALHQAPADWRVVGLSGQPVPGHKDLSDFTFACPNHPGVQEALSKELEALIRTGVYQGFFLDRIRFPSPACDPRNALACFCEHCRRKAEGLGVDLEAARQAMIRLGRESAGILSMALALLETPPARPFVNGGPFHDFLDFRCRSVTDLCAVVAAQIHRAGLEVGIDCFSPSLTSMVGQNLAALGHQADWIKIMTYAHTLAPAGLPFELGSLCDFLEAATGLDGTDILRRLSGAMQRPLPATPRALQAIGIPSETVGREVEAGVKQSSAAVLAGLELVDMPGVTHLNDAQIRADLRSIKAAGPQGLSLSWDLWHIPLHRLDLVREIYLEH